MSERMIAVPVRRDIDEQMPETHALLLKPAAANTLLSWLNLAKKLAAEHVTEIRIKATNLLCCDDLFPIEVEPWAEDLLEENKPASIVKVDTIPPAASMARTEGLWARVHATGLLQLEVWVSDVWDSGYPMLSEDLDRDDLNRLMPTTQPIE